MTQMSKQSKLPVSTIIEGLQEGSKHSALVDFTKLGYTTRAQIFLKVDKKRRDGVAEYLARHPSINNVYRITNGYDFMAEGVFNDLLGLEDFREGLEDRFNIRQKKYYFIIDDIKREGFLTEPEFLLESLH